MRGNKILVSVLALALPLVPLAAVAEQPYVAIEQRLTPEQLREVGLTPAQLELLNRMLRDASAKTAAIEPPRAQQGQGVAAYIGFDDAPIKSRLKGSVSGWEPGTVFELENGQQWKVLKGSAKLYKPLDAPEVIVVPGVAGRWFMQVDEDVARPRVYRID